jgi:large subunit ribosomal protein L24
MAQKQFDPKHEIKTKLRKGDEVVVLTGKSRGAVATIEEVDRKAGRVYIAGKNFNKKHQKPDPNNQDGGIVDVPLPLHISNVALVDPKTRKPTRLGFKVEGDKKVRVARKSGQAV